MSKKSETVEESKEVTVAKSHEVSAVVSNDGFGAGDDIKTSDIKIDLILLTQAMSKRVLADEVEKGLLITQSSMEELARHKKTEMEFIPFKTVKYWIETDKDTKEFIARYKGLTQDELPWEEKRGNRNIKRTFTHSFIVLLPSKIATMEDIPMEIAFRSTNLDCAKHLSTKIAAMRKRGVASWAKVFKLKVDSKTNAKGTWYITTDSISRDSTPEEIEAAKSWYCLLKDVETGTDNGVAEEYNSSAPSINQEESDY